MDYFPKKYLKKNSRVVPLFHSKKMERQIKIVLEKKKAILHQAISGSYYFISHDSAPGFYSIRSERTVIFGLSISFHQKRKWLYVKK